MLYIAAGYRLLAAGKIQITDHRPVARGQQLLAAHGSQLAASLSYEELNYTYSSITFHRFSD